MNTTTEIQRAKSGYDLPVYGIDSGEFLEFHIRALVCIAISCSSAITVSVVSFVRQGFRSFFSWSKGERFVIYLALCDGLYNISHSLDHAHYLISENHVRPEWLCELYAFILIEFILAQSLMVNIIAFSAFILMSFGKHVNFGKRDWRLLTYTFGVPFLGGLVVAFTKQLGPSGAFCYFDAVNGSVANIFFSTVPLMLVTILNGILYILTWRRIRIESKKIARTLGSNASSANSSTNAAKSMMLFVAAFFIQWWALSLFGVWALVTTPPELLFKMVTTFSNLGGVFNAFVYIIIRYKIRRDAKKRSNVVKDDKIANSTISKGVESTSFTDLETS